MSNANDTDEDDAASEASHISDPNFEPPPSMRAAVVLCTDGLVRAYSSVASARAERPATGSLEHAVTQLGMKVTAASGEHHYTLLIEAAALEGEPPPAAAARALDESLLRTNVQKAVRRQDAVAARASVLQYMAQRPAEGRHEYQRKLLVRLAVMAAEPGHTRWAHSLH